MAGKTFNTDLSHFAGAVDPAATRPSPAAKMAAFLGRIVHAMTSRPSTRASETGVPCRRRARCQGKVQALLEGLVRLHWRCDRCEERGVISNWRGSEWDVTGRASPS